MGTVPVSLMLNKIAYGASLLCLKDGVKKQPSLLLRVG